VTPEESMLQGDAIIDAMGQFIAHKGFTFLAVVLGRELDLTGERHQPTSSAIYCSDVRVSAPGFPAIARQLREMADQLDARFAQLGLAEAEESHHHVLVNGFAPAGKGDT